MPAQADKLVQLHLLFSHLTSPDLKFTINQIAKAILVFILSGKKVKF
jgi:hypothetical protein